MFAEIVKAGQQFLEKDSNIKIAKVHGPDNPELLKKMNVTGYPTLFYYRNADDKTLRTEEMYEPIKYEGTELAGYKDFQITPVENTSYIKTRMARIFS